MTVMVAEGRRRNNKEIPKSITPKINTTYKKKHAGIMGGDRQVKTV
jgi:hypothetical protein